VSNDTIRRSPAAGHSAISITMLSIFLILLIGFLSVCKRLQLLWVLAYSVSRPEWVYTAAIAIIVFLRLGLALYRLWCAYSPVLTGFIRSLQRLSTETNSSKPNGKPNGKRGMSTMASSSPTRVVPKGTIEDGVLRNKDKRSYKPLNMGNKFTKRVMDKFFKVIAKKGALVSLTKDRNKPRLRELFAKVGWRMFSAVFTAKGNFSSRMRQLNAFYAHLTNMRRHHGTPYVVKYCKVSQLAISKAIAGTPVKSLCVLDPSLFFPYVSGSGLPKFIPIKDRNLIIKNSAASVMRWWLTLYSVYRVIYIPTVLKLETITAPLTVPTEQVIQVAEELLSVFPQTMMDLTMLRYGTFKFLESASSTSKVS